MLETKKCILDESKLCDDCGECNRCDLDPNKICDNCCRCIAEKDNDSEFRTVTVKCDSGDAETKQWRIATESELSELDEEIRPIEPDEELTAYWERVLREHGEAPADDGFGETDTVLLRSVKRKRHNRTNK